MVQSAAQAQANLFYFEVASNKIIWTLCDQSGFPAPLDSEGNRAMPFWSSQERVKIIIRTIPEFEGFDIVKIRWDEFKDRWLPGLEKDGLLVGINWSGDTATGYDVLPKSILENIEYLMLKG